METPKPMKGAPMGTEAEKGADATKKSAWGATGLHYTPKDGNPITTFDEDTDQGEWEKDKGWIPDTPIEYKLPVPTTLDVSSYGEPITSKAAIKMIKDGKWAKLRDKIQEARAAADQDQEKQMRYDRLLNTPLAVTFSREVLLFLLAQPTCAGVKFYFCTNHSGHQSLVLVGVNADNIDLGTKGSIVTKITEKAPEQESKTAGKDRAAEKEDTLVFEVGGPKSVKDYLDYFEQNKKNPAKPLDEFIQIVGEYFS